MNSEACCLSGSSFQSCTPGAAVEIFRNRSFCSVLFCSVLFCSFVRFVVFCCLPLVFASILLFLKAVIYFFSLCAVFLHVFLVKDNESLPCIAINYSQVTTLFIYGTFGNGIISQTFLFVLFSLSGLLQEAFGDNDVVHSH